MANLMQSPYGAGMATAHTEMATAHADQFAHVPEEVTRLYTNFHFSLDPPFSPHLINKSNL